MNESNSHHPTTKYRSILLHVIIILTTIAWLPSRLPDFESQQELEARIDALLHVGDVTDLDTKVVDGTQDDDADDAVDATDSNDDTAVYARPLLFTQRVNEVQMLESGTQELVCQQV